ncbi:hypothetical protein [Sphingomonas rosea]|uniref:hypothetical protein n=1 Tax=Sphingomonas rosea TaxID=335605 RepID=UPI0031DE5C23
MTRLKRQAAKPGEPVAGGEPLGHSRPFPASAPYLLLMLSMAVLSIAIIMVTWPKSEAFSDQTRTATEKVEGETARRSTVPAR